MRFVRCKTTSEYEAMILSPEQAYAVLLNLQEPERTLTLLAAGTGLRISECLGLQWLLPHPMTKGHQQFRILGFLRDGGGDDPYIAQMTCE